ncbi:MAG TPA: hypothetical protein VF222_05220, partial [Nitrososphaeraceae archaeon]
CFSLNAIIPDTIYNTNPGIPHSCIVSIRITPHKISANPTTFVFFIQKTIKRPASLIAIISTEISTASAKKNPKIGIPIRGLIKK